jgi:hypothetical protein
VETGIWRWGPPDQSTSLAQVRAYRCSACVGYSLGNQFFNAFASRFAADHTERFRAKCRRWSVYPRKEIAVLPIENLSNHQENAYFTEGVGNEILTDLAKIADLRVISRGALLSCWPNRRTPLMARS